MIKKHLLKGAKDAIGDVLIELIGGRAFKIDGRFNEKIFDDFIMYVKSLINV